MHRSARHHAILAAIVLVPAVIVATIATTRSARSEQTSSSPAAAPEPTMSVDEEHRLMREHRAATRAERAVEAAAADGIVEAPAPEAPPARTVWDRLADCESGDWDAGGQPLPGTARWDYGLSFDHGDTFEGGLNFHPDTWDAYRDPGMADHAGNATRGQQIAVAERVLDAQGWGAWPVCSSKLGLR